MAKMILTRRKYLPPRVGRRLKPKNRKYVPGRGGHSAAEDGPPTESEVIGPSLIFSLSENSQYVGQVV